MTCPLPVNSRSKADESRSIFRSQIGPRVVEFGGVAGAAHLLDAKRGVEGGLRGENRHRSLKSMGRAGQTGQVAGRLLLANLGHLLGAFDAEQFDQLAQNSSLPPTRFSASSRSNSAVPAPAR